MFSAAISKLSEATGLTRAKTEHEKRWQALADATPLYADVLVRVITNPSIQAKFKDFAFEMLFSPNWRKLSFQFDLTRDASMTNCLRGINEEHIERLSPALREKAGQKILLLLEPLEKVSVDRLPLAAQCHSVARLMLPYVSPVLGMALAQNYDLRSPDSYREGLEPTGESSMMAPLAVRDVVNREDIDLTVRRVILDRYKARVSTDEVAIRTQNKFPVGGLKDLVATLAECGWKGASMADIDAEVLALYRNFPNKIHFMASQVEGLLRHTTPGGEAQRVAVRGYIDRCQHVERHALSDRAFICGQEGFDALLLAAKGDVALEESIRAIPEKIKQYEVEQKRLNEEGAARVAAEWEMLFAPLQ